MYYTNRETETYYTVANATNISNVLRSQNIIKNQHLKFTH